jgi:hypothetical protein
MKLFCKSLPPIVPMPADLKGMVVDRRTALRDVLQHWIRINIDIAESWSKFGDAPWWYNERASLSVFAGAIWQCGGVALEEFSEEKHFAARRGARRKPYTGRCDIFFEMGYKEFVAEAKFGWSGATSKNWDIAPQITDLLDDARKATGRLAPNGQCRLAIVFVAPYFTPKFKGDEVPMMHRWIEKIREVRCSSKAWVFPKASRWLKWRGDRYFPGAAVFIQEVKRSI